MAAPRTPMADLKPQMLLGRMAYRLSLLCLATWTTLPAIAAAQTTNNIPREILDYVPTCAQACFESFVSANFDGSVCGDSPSLQCLCRQQGNSGYTIGEGATSCIAGETLYGACMGQDGIDEAKSTGYNMCIGVSSAEPKTHTKIIATFILPSSGTGPLLFPTVTKTASTGTAAQTATTSPTSTANLSTGDELGSTTASRGGISPIPTNNASSGAHESGDDESEKQPKLTSAQIAGITLGCAAVVVFGILLVLLARCVRKKRFGDLESGFSKMRDSMSFGRNSRPSSGGGLQITSPLPRFKAERNPADPRWHPTVPKGAVGLAISPLAARGGVFAKPSPALATLLSAPLPPTPPADPVPAPAPARARAPRSMPKFVLSPATESVSSPAERSPPKPALTLAIPKGQKRVAVPANARDSVVTEFAEDGEGDITSATAVWRPPPTDPQSATTVYFADKGGNWILRNASNRAETSRRVSGPVRPVIQEVPAAPVEVELPSPDHKTKAERAKDAYGSFSPDALVSPLRLPRKTGGQQHPRLGSPIAFKDQRREPQFSSPSLSARLSQTAETLGKTPPQPNNQTPDLYFAMMRESRDLTGGTSKRRSIRRTNRRVSQNSTTSIESAAEDEDVIEDEPQVDLSPVAESPQTPISPGKSPVTYPKIRKRNDGQQMAQPKKAPESDLLPPAHKYNVWHPPGHSSATGASPLPRTRTVTPAIPQQSGPRRPWNAPNLRPAPNRNPAQSRTGSPEIRPGPVSPLQPENQRPQRQRQAANPTSYWDQNPNPQQPRARPPPPTPPYELPGENTPPASLHRYETPPQQYQQYQHPHPHHHQQHQHQNQRHRPGAGALLPTPAATPQPNETPNNNQGSLLAKRRGADKAAALALNGKGGRTRKGGGGGGGSSSRAGWTREEQQYGPVPITPGWVPELTPTRRGGDLVLSVR